jgi:hypothetical protein
MRVRFQKTDEGWKPADEGKWRHQSIEWNLGCLGRLVGLCAAIGGIVAVGVGVWLHVNPFVLIVAFLFRYWEDALACAALLFVAGVLWDYLNSLERETSFQEALMESLNAINARLKAIEAAINENTEE